MSRRTTRCVHLVRQASERGRRGAAIDPITGIVNGNNTRRQLLSLSFAPAVQSRAPAMVAALLVTL
jgi:hypothetical protein